MYNPRQKNINSLTNRDKALKNQEKQPMKARQVHKKTIKKLKIFKSRID